MLPSIRICIFCTVTLALIWNNPAFALDIVVDGKPAATIVVEGDAPARAKSRPGRGEAGDRMAAQVLADWIKKITGADIPLANSAPKTGIAIYIGQSAIKAGLKLDDIESSTHEGLRIVCDEKRILLAGQNSTSTVKAACRLLEELGCRYLMDSPMGEIYPRTATLTVKEMDIRAKPGFALRQIWGSNWSGNSLWKIWNGAGGAQYSQGHAWGGYVSKDLFETHPEYFALRNGQRKKGDWYCTSNAELRKVFAAGVIRALEQNGGASASISPPDGIGYCECDRCRAQDDPQSLEPSSGHICVTDRYVDFFNDIARQVKTKFPQAKLNFYCYADYTQAPTHGVKLEPNLIAWIAPLRYCRLHAIGNPICPSRVQLQDLIDDWSKAGNIAYRTYNYNLAECCVPFPMLSIWEHDIPYLQKHGAIGINLETLPSWQIYGPHIYLSLRLAYDPQANADALLDDYMLKFYGPGAGPIMKQYWLEIDQAFAQLNGHAGSFFAIHRVYTPDFLQHCQALLDKAAAATKNDPASAARVAIHAEGFRNARQYAQLRDAMNSGKTAEMQDIYKDLLARATAQTAAGYSNHYTPDYVKRFLGKDVEAAATARANGNRVVMVLPDQMRLNYDEQDKGLAEGFAKPDFDDAKWKTVATFSQTLDGQQMPDRKTIMWYRNTFEVPQVKGKLTLFFMEVDGTSGVYINGNQVITDAKKRLSFEVDAAGLHPGKNTIAIRVDHSAISELFLGGIIRPIYLIEKQVQ